LRQHAATAANVKAAAIRALTSLSDTMASFEDQSLLRAEKARLGAAVP